MSAIKCECATGTGYKVEIRWPASPGIVTPCCTCTIDKYRVMYGEPTFTITPVNEEPTP
jgi:hypothetical protein